MLKLNKKIINLSLLASILLFASIFSFNIKEVQANSLVFNQVKTPNSATVYYIHQATGQRKAYINEAVFLDYGNKWSDVKVISPEVLDRFVDVRLVKTESSDDLYYINTIEGTKIKMNDLQNIFTYNLENVLPITISEFELSQYQFKESYQAAGLEKDLGLSVSVAPFRVNGNGLVLVPGTKNNSLISFKMTASKKAAIVQNITFNLSGLYNSDLIDKAYLVNAQTGERIKSSSSFKDRQVTIRFNSNDLIIPANQTLTFELRLDFHYKEQIWNQTIKASLESFDSIEANLAIQGILPITGPKFKFINADSILAQVKIEEESLNRQEGQKELAKFIITETSGREDVYIRELVFRNQGSASARDLEAFRLRRDGHVISAAPKMVSNRIIFPINYLRVPAGTSVTVSVSANLVPDYQANRSVNLSLEHASVEGAIYNLFLPVEIINQDASFILQ